MRTGAAGAAAAVHTLLINNCCHEFSTRRFLRALLVCILKFIYLCSLHTHSLEMRILLEWIHMEWSVYVLLLERTEECIWSDNVIRILNWGAFPVILLLTCIYLGILRSVERRSTTWTATPTGASSSLVGRRPTVHRHCGRCIITHK